MCGRWREKGKGKGSGEEGNAAGGCVAGGGRHDMALLMYLFCTAHIPAIWQE